MREFRVLYANLCQSDFSLSQMAILPIHNYLDEDCVLLLLVDNQLLPTGIALIDTWNFTYITKNSFVTLDEDSTTPLIEKPAYDLLIGKRGYVKVDESPLTGILPDDNKWMDTIYTYIESTFHGPYLELFAEHQEPNWHCWSTSLPSTVDIFQGLPEGYLYDKAIQDILYSIRQASNASHLLPWTIGDAINELQANGLGKDASYFLAIDHIVGAKDSRWAMKMSAVAKAFPKHHRDPSKTWETYYREYRTIREEYKLWQREKRAEIFELGKKVESVVGPFMTWREQRKEKTNETGESSVE